MEVKDKEALTREREAIGQELVLVSEKAPFGSHAKVAKKVGISSEYSIKIRQMNGAKMATTENIDLIRDMVREYRKIINKEIEKLRA